MNNGCHHLQMGQFLSADIVEDSHGDAVGSGEALGKIAHGSAHFTVGAAVLADDNLGQLGIGTGDVYRILKSFFIIPHN